MKENLIKKFLSFSYGSWIGLVIGFFSTMLTTRILSPQDFGKVSMFTLAIKYDFYHFRDRSIICPIFL